MLYEIEDIALKMSVGPLLYSPALNSNLSKTIFKGTQGGKYSLALCLEDTISPSAVERAQNQVKETFAQIWEMSRNHTEIYIPPIFVRVREPEQISIVYDLIEEYSELFTGFILPKYTVTNAKQYNEEMLKINRKSGKKIYMMPILESRDLVDFRSRGKVLDGIKKEIDSVKKYVLNVRVGGNDFSNEFAVRRHCDETIYDILPLAQLIGDILTVFSREYVLSGPVWEYFSSEHDEWEQGMRRELKLDILNGFVGKTVIHPNQIPIVNEMLRVTEKDFEDAKSIVNWDHQSLQVGKSYGGERMNEVRTNYNWARKILILAEIYGVK